MASAAAAVTTDVLIIGAGWSGLSAAVKLAQAGRKVVLLEGRERIGGRAFTHTWNDQTTLNDTARTADAGNNTGNEYWCDFGCSWMHGYNEGSPLKSLAERYRVPVTVPAARDTVVVGANGPLSKAMSSRLTGNLAKAQAEAKERAANVAAAAPDNGVSLADFLYSPESALFTSLESEQDKQHARDTARMLHIPLGIELEKASLKWTGFEHSYAGTDAAPQGGFQSLINKMVQETTSLGSEIKTAQHVERILDEENQVKVTVKGGGEYTARTALVTVPLAVLKRSTELFYPPLPERRLDTIQRTSVGNLNKVLLHYDAVWWGKDVGTFIVLPTNDKSSGDELTNLFATNTLIVSSLCSSSGNEGSGSASNSLLVMIGGQAALALEQYERVQVGKALHAYLAARLVAGTSEAAAPPKHVFYSRWGRQALTGGATTSPVSVSETNSPLDFTVLGRPLWSGRLGFAGEHTDQDHRGSAAGAYITGQREADRLLVYLDKHVGPVEHPPTKL